MQFQICNLQELHSITDLYLLGYTQHMERHFAIKTSQNAIVRWVLVLKLQSKLIRFDGSMPKEVEGKGREDRNEMFASQMILKIKCNTKNANHKKNSISENLYLPDDERHMCSNSSSGTNNNNDNQNGNSQCKHKNSILYANDRKVIKS